MRKVILALGFLLLFGFGGTAAAASWVPVAETDGYLVDIDSAVIDENYLYYWEVITESDSGASRLCYYRVELKNPERAKLIRGYLYDPEHRMQFQITRLGSSHIWPGSLQEKAVELARSYSRPEKAAPDNFPVLPWDEK